MKYLYITLFVFFSITINAQTSQTAELGDVTGLWSFPRIYNYDEEGGIPLISRKKVGGKSKRKRRHFKKKTNKKRNKKTLRKRYKNT